MHGQVTRAILAGLLGGWLLGGCGSGGKPQVDGPSPSLTQSEAGVSTQPDAGTATQPGSGDSDAGCDEDAMGTDWCIKNWPANVGGGEIVTRQNPVNYTSCKQ
jgi:hypothetical protein